MKTAEELRTELAYCTGSEHLYRFLKGDDRLLYTDGIKTLVEGAEAYWLLVDVAAYQYEKKFMNEDFQVWTLELDGTKAVLRADDGNGNLLAEQEYSYTDFPLPEGIKLYVENNTILLPSER